MKQSENVKTLLEALVKVQSEFHTLPKDKSGYGYYYTDLDTVITYVRPILSKHNIGFMQALTTVDGKNGISTRLFNSNGEWIEDATALPEVQLKGTNTAQNMGAAITYMKRYALCAILGISSDEDTDANVGVTKTAETPKSAPKDKAPAGGEDTPEQRAKIKELLSTKDADGNEIFKAEKPKITAWRQERTAEQVIKYLEEEKKKKLGDKFPEDIPWGEEEKQSEDTPLF